MFGVMAGTAILRSRGNWRTGGSPCENAESRIPAPAGSPAPSCGCDKRLDRRLVHLASAKPFDTSAPGSRRFANLRCQIKLLRVPVSPAPRSRTTQLALFRHQVEAGPQSREIWAILIVLDHTQFVSHDALGAVSG